MFFFECEVYYEDTDMGGRVYHANYLKFVERARSKLLTNIGIDQRGLLENDGLYFIVKKISAEYLSPSFFGDKLLIKTRLLEIKKATLILGQKVLRKDKTLFDCEVKIALLNSGGKVTKLPNELVSKIKLFFESQ
jgi:acyl-CoA thioester hydrolase